MGKLMSWTGRKGTGAVRRLSIPARRVAAALFSVTLLSGAAVAWSAASANAGIAQASSSSAKAVPDAAVNAILYFHYGGSFSYPCTRGSTYSVNAIVIHVLNECGVRVWLHQNSNNTGVNFCVSKVSSNGSMPQIKYAN